MDLNKATKRLEAILSQGMTVDEAKKEAKEFYSGNVYKHELIDEKRLNKAQDG